MNFFDFLVGKKYSKSRNVIKINGDVNFDRNKFFDEIMNFGLPLSEKYEKKIQEIEEINQLRLNITSIRVPTIVPCKSIINSSRELERLKSLHIYDYYINEYRDGKIFFFENASITCYKEDVKFIINKCHKCVINIIDGSKSGDIFVVKIINTHRKCFYKDNNSLPVELIKDQDVIIPNDFIISVNQESLSLYIPPGDYKINIKILSILHHIKRVILQDPSFPERLDCHLRKFIEENIKGVEFFFSQTS